MDSRETYAQQEDTAPGIVVAEHTVQHLAYTHWAEAVGSAETAPEVVVVEEEVQRDMLLQTQNAEAEVVAELILVPKVSRSKTHAPFPMEPRRAEREDMSVVQRGEKSRVAQIRFRHYLPQLDA
jgi:hypothetical protein